MLITCTVEEYEQEIDLNKIANLIKCKLLRTSQETLPFVNWLVSILNFVRFQRFRFNLVPRLSPLPPFVIGRKTLVAVGHVTTQNLGGKKICWARRVAQYFDCCCEKLGGFHNSSSR